MILLYIYLFIFINYIYIFYISDMHINNIMYCCIFENLTGSRFLFFIDVQVAKQLPIRPCDELLFTK